MQENTKSILWILAFISALAVITGLFIYGPVSATDKERYGKACREWIAKEFNNGRSAQVSDVWRKRGNLVFEVLAPNAEKTRHSVYLCVVDTKKGTLFKPGAFENSSWR